MTHKNPELRTSSAVPAKEEKTSPSRPSVPRKPESFKKKAPPRKELDGNKWMIVSARVPEHTLWEREI
jgi:adenylyl cyclase-associated protein